MINNFFMYFSYLLQKLYIIRLIILITEDKENLKS